MKMPTYPDDGSASKRLWFKLYRVKAPRSLTMTREEIEMYGQRVTGVKELDSYLANQMVTGRVNVIRMAQIIDAGGSIMFCDKFDAKKVYVDTYQHILNWEHILATRYNVSGPPIEDFDILRGFLEALEVYSGLFDRDDITNNPIGAFSKLSGKDFRRRRIPERIQIGGGVQQDNHQHIEIRSWDDINKLQGG